ncbi:glycine zipper family protein [Silvibacterium dinghuense]|uniref:TrbI/VirB10 family protein n=1 Tax=Silvibacterium dinghuense TaxID=1560006 RepID=A0A4Q1SG02_9BACT|nr:glycine zipper family protein [Silvibacterium dinghuense]RXS96464.1 hypothetical protein ESZ00_00430 [Silvibacterium dinghuense]GGG90979.1 hypothetical protein GCM10011586_01910 [Silvibacterium dinghuense]
MKDLQMKGLRSAWKPGLLVVATLALSGAAWAQQATTPQSDQYQGVSQPPPDDTITASPDPAPPAVKPSPATPAAAPVQPAYVPPPPPVRPATPASDDNYDIVTSVPVQQNDATPYYRNTAPVGATLQTRDSNAGIVTSVSSPANELGEGTDIRVRLADRLSTRDTEAGTSFKGEITTAVFKDGRVIIPPGSVLKGRVMSVRQGHHLSGPATLRLRPDMVILPDGTAYHLYAQLVGTEARGTKTDAEGGVQPSSHWKKDTAEYGVGAGTGAVVGAEFAGPTGALVGAGVGATLVTAHLLMKHPEAAVLPAGSVVTFSLSEPMELTPTRN